MSNGVPPTLTPTTNQQLDPRPQFPTTRGLLPPHPPIFPQYTSAPTADSSHLRPPFLPMSSHSRPIPIPPPPHPHQLLLNPSSPSPCFAPPNNPDKDLKDKVADDTFFTVRDRKVRISDRGSVYALCRSWLRNGYPEQSQPHYGDGLKALPRPSPMRESSSLKRKESDDETESDEEEKAVEILSTEELLRGHIRRAKRIRQRLREERLERIKRYNGRLSLLLPTQPVEQYRNDLSNGS